MYFGANSISFTGYARNNLCIWYDTGRILININQQLKPNKSHTNPNYMVCFNHFWKIFVLSFLGLGFSVKFWIQIHFITKYISILNGCTNDAPCTYSIVKCFLIDWMIRYSLYIYEVRNWVSWRFRTCWSRWSTVLLIVYLPNCLCLSKNSNRANVIPRYFVEPRIPRLITAEKEQEINQKPRTSTVWSTLRIHR